MRGDGDPGMVVRSEHLVKYPCVPSILRIVGLGSGAIPEFVLLSETVLNLVVREQVMDIRLAPPPVACVDANGLPEKLLHGRHEGVIIWEVQARECYIRRLEGTSHRRCVIGLRIRNVLVGDLVLPEVMRDLGLRDAIRSEVGVEPVDSRVTIQFSPVALEVHRISVIVGFKTGGIRTFQAGVP